MFEISWEGKVNLPSITVSNNYPVPLSVILRLKYLAWNELFCLARGFYNKTTTRGSRFLIHVTWQNLIFVTSDLKGDICGTGNECYQHDEKPKKKELWIIQYNLAIYILVWMWPSNTYHKSVLLHWSPYEVYELARFPSLASIIILQPEQHSFVYGLVCSSCVSAEIKVQLVITVKYLVFIHTQ